MPMTYTYNIGNIIAKAKAGVSIDINHDNCIVSLNSMKLKITNDSATLILENGTEKKATKNQIDYFFK